METSKVIGLFVLILAIVLIIFLLKKKKPIPKFSDTPGSTEPPEEKVIEKTEPLPPAKIPEKWRFAQIRENTIVFSCTACKESYKFESSVFANNPAEHIEGLIKSDKVVQSSGLGNLIALVLAVIVFIVVHKALYGPTIVIGFPLIVPAFAAVLTYSIGKIIFPAINLIGKGLPIYRFRCRQCQSEIFIATDGKKLAFPLSAEGSKTSSKQT